MIVQATKTFRQRLREAMEKAGLSQRELAQRAKAGYPGINRILQGKQDPTLELADRLADALGVPLSALIDPEFAALCGTLSAEELSLLEQQIERDGCLDPIILWANHDDTIIDGHHRHDICTRLGVTFKTKSLRFDSRDDVIEWIACHQLGRRNASEETKDYLRGKRYHAEKKEVGGRADRDLSGDHNDHPKTADKLAAEYNVSPATIKRDAKFAESVDALAEVAGPEVKAKILSGDSGLSKKDIVTIAELPAREQKAAIKAVLSGQPADVPSKPVPISDTFYKSLKGLAERIEGIREQYGTVREMFGSSIWNGSDTQIVIELVHELHQMFRDLDKEMKEYGENKTAKRPQRA